MAATIEYKCPCCGGNVEYNASMGQMQCPFCDTIFDVAALMEKDEALNNVQPDQMEWQTPEQGFDPNSMEGMNVFTCRSCGGELMTDANTAATQCPFCGNPIVLSGRLSGALKPDYVIPFKVTKQQAKDQLKQFMSKKKLLPKSFASDSHLDEIKGVYVPFWLFEADADAHINYMATRTRTWSDRDFRYTETQHYRLIREGSVGFENVPVDGSKLMPDDMMESIEPFNFAEALPFQTAYLSGYLADKYDVDKETSKGRANERIKRTTQSVFAGTTGGYATVTPESTTVNLRNTNVRYALYPVWLLTTTYEDKKYQFAMNGQTGKFVGNMPMDKKAYWKWQLLYTAMFGAGAWVLLFLLGMLLGL